MLLRLFIYANFLLMGRRSSGTDRCRPDRCYVGPDWSLWLRWSHWARLRPLRKSRRSLDWLSGLRKARVENFRVWFFHSHWARHCGGRVHWCWTSHYANGGRTRNLVQRLRRWTRHNTRCISLRRWQFRWYWSNRTYGTRTSLDRVCWGSDGARLLLSLDRLWLWFLLGNRHV